MIAVERVYKVIWPGPGRLKVRRCLFLSFFTGIVVFILTISFHFGDEQVNHDRFTTRNVNKLESSKHGMLIEMENHHEELSRVAASSRLYMKYLSRNRSFTGRIDEIQVLSSYRDSTTTSSFELLTEIESLMTPPNTGTSIGTYKARDRLKSTFKSQTSVQIVPKNWNMVPAISFKAANFIVVHDSGMKPLSGEPPSRIKHLMILGHYEQLGKTTINYMLAARLAFMMNRKIVKPFVADSRFCGLTSGWTGMLRSGTRAFKPLDLYYNVSALQLIFTQRSLADMEYLRTFTDSCSFSRNGRKIVIIYLLYQGNYHNKYLMLGNSKLLQIKHLLDQSDGWVDCSFINSHLKLDKRIGEDIKAGKQYCVDPEKLTDWEILENKVLKNDPCVVIHQWRGLGFQRTHFNITLDLPPQNLLNLIEPSNFVIAEVMRSLKMIGKEFVGIHIRSERQLLWYGLEKWLRCMNLVYHEAKKIAVARSMKVFISSDTGEFGSDQLSLNLNKNQLKIINAKYKWLVERLSAVTYSVLRPKHHIWTDRGLVALIQLHVLSQASFLITLGAGTFQKWITDTFKDRREKYGDQSWTITKVCFSELRNWQELQNAGKGTKQRTMKS